MRTEVKIILALAVVAFLMLLYRLPRYKFYESSGTASFFVLDTVTGNLWFGRNGREQATKVIFEK